jgi:TetR/AcrR family transcriptional repressor of nem operon
MEARGDTRSRLVHAMIHLMRQRGYDGTRVDDIAARVGMTKGAFFHNFSTKDEIAHAALDAWAGETAALFSSQPLAGDQSHDAPARLIAYLDLRKSLMTGEPETWSCLAGALLQEQWRRDPALGEAAARVLLDQTAFIETLAASALDGSGGDPSAAHRLALMIQATLQGAAILARTPAGNAAAVAAIEDLQASLAARLVPARAGKKKDKKKRKGKKDR